MKKIKYWLMTLAAVMAVSTLSACGSDKEKDEPGNPNKPDQPTVTDKDPQGTIISNMLCGSNMDSSTEIDIPSHTWENGLKTYQYELYILNDMNWNYYDYYSECGGLADVGEVRNISAITTIPKEGWGKPAVQPGHGYIARVRGRFWNGDEQEYYWGHGYTRIYVTQYLTSGSGSIIGATIKYQPNWKYQMDENQ